jgi:hypothetical protein
VPDTVNGLPVHVLLVHAVVVLVPLCAALLVAAAALPAVRARLGGALPLLAAGCVVLVPVTTSAGQSLRRLVGGGGPLVERHAHLGGQLLPWTVGLLLLSLVVWWQGRQARDLEPVAAGRQPTPSSTSLTGTRGAARPALLVQVAVLLVCAVVAVGTVVTVVRIGESGSRAVWSGVTQQS